MHNPEEPHAEPGAACRTPFCKKIEGTADFEVNILAPKEETDGLFLSYTVVQGTPLVCDALAKSRNEFSQAPQSHKVVLRWLPLRQEPKLNLLYLQIVPNICEYCEYLLLDVGGQLVSSDLRKQCGCPPKHKLSLFPPTNHISPHCIANCCLQKALHCIELHCKLPFIKGNHCIALHCQPLHCIANCHLQRATNHMAPDDKSIVMPLWH